MKKLISTLIISVLAISFIKGQDDTTQPGSITIEKAKIKNVPTEEFFGQNMQFPESVIINKKNVNVVISFIITKNGTIDSVRIIKSSDKNASIKALVTIDESDGLWEPAKINGTPTDWRYIASFHFVTSPGVRDQKAKIQKLIKKKKFEDALKLADEEIKLDEYDKDLYQLRSTIYKGLDQSEQLEADLKEIEEIDRNLLIDMSFAVFGIPHNFYK